MTALVEAPARADALAVRGLTKSFGPTIALDGLDLTIAAGEVHALVGENGSGKSTLIKLLAGYHHADHGFEIEVGGATVAGGAPAVSYASGIRFVHQDLALIDACSVADNLALNTGFPQRFGTVRRRELERRAREDLERVGLDLDPQRLVATLSPAERTGVAVARALREDPAAPVRVLVLDEPTATLADAEVERLLDIIRAAARSGAGVLYVTHRLDEIFRVAANVTVLRDGRRVACVPVATLTRDDLVELMVGSELDDVRRASAPLLPRDGDPLAAIADLHGASVHGVSLEVRSGDLVGIAGITGSGREALLSLVFGAAPRTAGSVVARGRAVPPSRPDLSMRAGMAFVPGDRARQAGFPLLTCRENVTVAELATLWRWPKLSRRRETQDVSSWVHRLGVRPGDPDASFSALSGGNQQKVILARWLRRSPIVLLLDEPTQGVDVGAKADIHAEILRAVSEGAGVVVSSSDTDELAALCHRVLVLRDGRVVDDLVGARVTPTEIAQACLRSSERRGR